MITYQYEQSKHQKCLDILGLINQAEKKQVNQKRWLNTEAAQWFDQLAKKTKREMEITGIAIKRLKIYYNNQLNSIKPLCTE